MGSETHPTKLTHRLASLRVSQIKKAAERKTFHRWYGYFANF